ncbi:hypothetical protein FHG64_18365 [Antarcticibacterium flavum]|uniref:Uncharacterized protein n=1 Tax=Antarcticibacterium flavum TaxID=2058175 RepID=A0A5B7X8Z0_9FLAO|nr:MULTISPECIES: hypothetical protein [Antarcticibacterium]MCM4160654.1 hypothetical protein [Antarcticibacterium sp. W02-3]QCY71198.1 hypothetical protein FHG64_18365 [Antarcticibacterium flavum]
MDELELLKKDWKKQEGNYPRLSYDQIYNMLWKKSSSIVKWIFVISILEFLFWALITIFFADNDYWKEMERLHLKEFTIAAYIVSYGITFFFIYLFYRNYQRISATDDSSTLMKNILKTRKTVKCYIAYILISTAVTTLVYTYFAFYYHPYTVQVDDVSKYTFTFTQWAIFIGVMALFFGMLLGLIWLFYRVIYGILLKRLNRNYKELKKLEM